MSRTIRRKNVTINRVNDFIDSEEDFTSSFLYSRRSYGGNRDYDQYVARMKAWFHSDQPQYFKPYYSGGIPRKYRNTACERPFRREVKAQLYYANKYDEWDNLSIRKNRFDWWVMG